MNDQASSPAPFFAHSTSRPDRSDWQPLAAHLQVGHEYVGRAFTGAWIEVALSFMARNLKSAETGEYLSGLTVGFWFFWIIPYVLTVAVA